MLHQNIRKIRLVSNFKQEYIADQLGISQPEYSKIENGKRVPSPGNLKKLCEIYDVPASVLFSEEQARKRLNVTTISETAPVSSRQIKETIKMFLESHANVQFNPEKQQEVAQYMFRSFMEFILTNPAGEAIYTR